MKHPIALIGGLLASSLAFGHEPPRESWRLVDLSQASAMET